MSQTENKNKTPKLNLANFAKSKLLDYTMITENLKSFNLILTTRAVVVSMTFFSLIFFLLCVFLAKLENPVTQKVRYDNIDDCKLTNDNNEYGKICNVDMTITQRLDFPIFVYYEIHGIVQNHFKYKRSISLSQLNGEIKNHYKNCDPLEKIDGKIIYPCGFVSTSYFSDKIIASLKTNGKTIDLVPGNTFDYAEDLSSWKKAGISMEEDRELRKNMNSNSEEFKEKFVRYGPRQKEINEEVGKNNETVLIPLPEDEDLIVWSKVHPWNPFRKLYRVIESIGKGQKNYLSKEDIITFKIKNYYKTNIKTQKKYIVISTKTQFGGSTHVSFFLSFCVFAISVVSIFVIFMNFLFFPRKYGDVTYLSK